MTTRPPDWKSFFDPRVGERTHELLENFRAVGTRQHLVLVSGDQFSQHLRENVRAATVASTLHLRSVDYAKRRYCESRDEEPKLDPVLDSYIATYYCVKNYIDRLLGKLHTEGRAEPSVGIFGASLVLERLPPSFFSAHLLYRLGHGYEGHAVSRLILEQIGWAYSAHRLNDLEAVSKIETTRAISKLKRFYPIAGNLYGFLSKKTHIDYQSHGEFIRVEDGRNMILHSQSKFPEYGRTLLLLADLFGLVWELSQFPYINEPEAILLGEDGAVPNPNRPFVTELHEHIDLLERFKISKEGS